MVRHTLAAAALCAGLAVPALAEGLIDMSEAERTALREEVRAYLLENPEVLMEAIAVLEQRQAQAQAQGDAQLVADNAEALFEDGHSHVAGNPDGDITVVEFLDYRCGYCRKAHPEVAELLARDGNIRLIVKEFPILGEQSMLASRFAIATLRLAGDAAYAKVSDALMSLRADVTEDSLRALAEEHDLDAEAILAEMQTPEVTAIIAENRALGQKMQINGTPSFVFGDEMVRGYVPLDTMEQLVAQEREG